MSSVCKHRLDSLYPAVCLTLEGKQHTFISCHLPHSGRSDDEFSVGIRELHAPLQWSSGELYLGMDANVEFDNNHSVNDECWCIGPHTMPGARSTHRAEQVIAILQGYDMFCTNTICTPLVLHTHTHKVTKRLSQKDYVCSSLLPDTCRCSAILDAESSSDHLPLVLTCRSIPTVKNK